MRKIIVDTNPNNIKGIKRILKPIVEKRRRDRINQSLGDLKTLLINITSDARLQNPKVEKTEILDVAVEYLQKMTSRQTRNVSHTPQCGGKQAQSGGYPLLLSSPDSRPPALPITYSTGFQLCVSQLSGFLSRATPAERDGLHQGLTSYMEDPSIVSPGQPPCPAPNTDFNHPGSNRKLDTASMKDIGCRSTQEAVKSSLLSNCSSCQPGGLAYPLSPDYISPPTSPCLSCSSSSVYMTPPPFPSLPSHFLFPPSCSPVSSKPLCSCSSSQHTMAAPGLSAALHLPSSPHIHLPSHPLNMSPNTRTELFTNVSQPAWRPWF